MAYFIHKKEAKIISIESNNEQFSEEKAHALDISCPFNIKDTTLTYFHIGIIGYEALEIIVLISKNDETTQTKRIRVRVSGIDEAVVNNAKDAFEPLTKVSTLVNKTTTLPSILAIATPHKLLDL